MAPTPHSSAHGDVGQIRRGLGALRRRIRGLVLLVGGAHVVAALAGCLGLFFLADWLLDLPLGVRRFVRLGLLDRPDGLAVVLWLPLLAASAFLAWALTRSRRPGAALMAFVAGGIVGLLAHVAARALRPLRVPLSDDDLALTVEQRFDHLDDRLAAALDFSDELAEPSRGESPAMMRRVVDEAEAEASRLRLGAAATSGRAARWIGIAGGALACVALLAVALPDAFGLWFRRSIQLEDTPWPQETHVVAVALGADGVIDELDPETPLDVSLGRPLVVHALAKGEVPGEVMIVDMAEGQRPLARRMFAVPDREGLFAFEFRDVRRPFSFVLEGGDDTDREPRYTVRITVPPRVVDIETTVVHPDYLGGGTETQPGGSATVPAGSQVTVRFGADVPLARAQVVVGDQTSDATREAGAEGADRYAFSFVADHTRRYQLVIATAEGHENDAGLDTHEIRVRRDRAPRLDWVHPRGSVEATAKGRIPLLVQAADDHAVRALRVQVHAADDVLVDDALAPWRTRENPAPGTRPATDRDAGERVLHAYVPLDIETLRLPSGEPLPETVQLRVRFVAEDSFGQVHEGEWVHVDVRTARELERSLSDRRPNIRAELQALRDEQRALRAELQELLPQVGRVARDDPDAGIEDTLKMVRFGQGRLGQDAGDAVARLFRLFNGFVLNRMGAENPTQKILARLDRHHRATYGQPPRSEDAGADSDRETPVVAVVGDPVFPYALYGAIVADWRAKRIYDRGLIDRMCAVLEDAVALGADAGPAAQQAAMRALSGEKADVEAAIAAQDRVVATLDRLLARMRSWQSLSDVTSTLRRLIEEQQMLREQMDPAASGGAAGENR